MVTRADIGGAVSLGYTDTTLVAVRNDACVRFGTDLQQLLNRGDPK